MSRSIEQALDTCIAQLHRGDDLEEILRGHSDIARELRPLLVAASVALIDIPPPREMEAHRAAFLAMVSERRRVVEMSDGYVNEVKAGVPVGELLETAPARMREVIAGAWRMHATPHPAFSPEKKEHQKARLMAMAAAKRARQEDRMALPRKLARGFAELFGALAPVPSAARRVGVGALATALACLVLMVGTAGIGPVAASSLPGEAFYRVKLLGESAQLFFAFDPEVREDLSIRFSQKRFEEIRHLVAEGREVPVGLISAWLNGDDDPWGQIETLDTADQRDLAEALLSSVAAQAELDDLRGSELADPAMGDLLVWARSQIDMARGSGLVESKLEEPQAAPPEFPTAPSPMRRPLPPDEAETSVEAVETDEPVQVLQPAPVSVEPEETQVADEPPKVVQPVSAASSDDGAQDDEEEVASDERGEPEQPVEPEEPATEAPPPYIQPPIDLPAPDADADADPGCGSEGDSEGGGTP